MAATPFSFSKAQQSTSRPLHDIMDITPALAQKQNWTAMVQVLKRHEERDFINSITRQPGRSRNYIVTDAKGTKVGMVCYDSRTLRKFRNTLLPYKRYLISNAQIRPVKPYFRIGNYGYSWTLNQATLVDAVEERVPPTLPCKFNLTRFADLKNRVNQLSPTNVKALVIGSAEIVDHKKTAATRDLIIINEEKIPMVMRLSEDLRDDGDITVSDRYSIPTLIIAISFKVGTHYGLSLTNKSDSYIMREPPLPEGQKLKEWYAENKEEIEAMIQCGDHKNPKLLMPPPKAEQLVTVKNAMEKLHQLRACWIHLRMYLLPAQDKLYYTACSKCNRSVRDDEGWNLTCPGCCQNTTLESRCRVGVFLNDESGTLEAIMFSPIAETLTTFSASELREACTKGNEVLQQVEKILENKAVYCFIKISESEYQGDEEISYIITNVYIEDEYAEYEAEQKAHSDISQESTTLSTHEKAEAFASSSNQETTWTIGKPITLASASICEEPPTKEKETSSEKEETTPISATNVHKLPAATKSIDQSVMKVGAKRSLDLGQGRNSASLTVDDPVSKTSETHDQAGVEKINTKKGKSEGKKA